MDDELASDPFSPTSIPNARGDMRDSLFLHAAMRLPPADASVPLRIRNLSAGGMMADCSATVHKGQLVEVGLRNIGSVPGRIVWARNGQIGVAFLERIDPRVARNPVSMHPTAAMLMRPPNRIERRPGLRTK